MSAYRELLSRPYKIRIMKKKHNELVKMYKKSRNDRGGVVYFISEEKAGVLL